MKNRYLRYCLPGLMSILIMAASVTLVQAGGPRNHRVNEIVAYPIVHHVSHRQAVVTVNAPFLRPGHGPAVLVINPQGRLNLAPRGRLIIKVVYAPSSRLFTRVELARGYHPHRGFNLVVNHIRNTGRYLNPAPCAPPCYKPRPRPCPRPLVRRPRPCPPPCVARGPVYKGRPYRRGPQYTYRVMR
ncbi:hypothetical protein [Dethiosulfatarculus sandiegensis]|uniref:Pilus formation protein N-terminal domain-containing protein n=1 Tax=Dethiosulfatarculus sandiegensis TaxID=1429043 RepID=A0A0D2GFW7_9BACT|nr:hypothetical protein [Dethiosulfatarculus sandiegensis]KIX13822.1 hypothetical protein X474_10995 [Dethiosulfatarculus sandiegensis]